jgi:hypothetical protein
MVFDGPGRREAARGSGHTTEGPLSLPLLLRSCFMLAIAQVMASASCRCSGRKYPALTSFAIISFGKGTTSLISQVRAFVDRHWGRCNLCAKRQTSGRRLRPPAMKEIQKTRWARSGVEVGFMRGIGDIIEIMKVVPVVALELRHRKRLKPGKSNTQTPWAATAMRAKQRVNRSNYPLTTNSRSRPSTTALPPIARAIALRKLAQFA